MFAFEGRGSGVIAALAVAAVAAAYGHYRDAATTEAASRSGDSLECANTWLYRYRSRPTPDRKLCAVEPRHARGAVDDLARPRHDQASSAARGRDA